MAATVPRVWATIIIKEPFVSLFVDVVSRTIPIYILVNGHINSYDEFTQTTTHIAFRKHAQLIDQYVRLQAFFRHVRRAVVSIQDEFTNTNSPIPSPKVQGEEMDFDNPTIGELIAAGSDMADITARISDLTNEIHPIFRTENICSCKYRRLRYCTSPHLSAHPGEEAEKLRVTATTSPYPTDNFVVRAVLQLATRFLTHEDTLPFWAGIIDCGRGPRQDVSRFRVHPRKRLSKARETDILNQLIKFADEVRVHFVGLEEDEYQGTSEAYAILALVGGEEPDIDPAKRVDLAAMACYHTTLQQCDCPKGPIYAFRNGKPVVEESNFHHIVCNTKKMLGFDQSSDQWRAMTIWDLKTAIFDYASVICHELAHAFMKVHCQREGFMNEECLSELGFSWENFTFGGLIHRGPDGTIFVIPWPNKQYLDHYMGQGHAMAIRYFGKLQIARYLAPEPLECHKFLDQSFWDEETPKKVFKKMWLKPYHEDPTYEEEYAHFSSGHEAPMEVSAKKRRLSNAAMDRARAYASKIRRSEGMARADRWHRCREVLLERKADFHDRAKDRLNALWTSCSPAIGENMFWQ